MTEEGIPEFAISLERDLEEYLVHNLSSIQKGLKLYSKESVSGRQFNTDVGRIDILGLDEKMNFVVLELKAGRADISTLGQILSYMGWVQTNLARGKEVKGIVIANDFDKKIKVAASIIPNLVLKQYQVSFEFRDIVWTS